MNKLLLLFCVFCLSNFSYALSGQAYMDRFNTYTNWAENLPNEPSDEFIAFISPNTPLSNKLRDKWLYHLASLHNWSLFSQYYRPNNDLTLACDAQIAYFHQDQAAKALEFAKPLWLQGTSQPPACNQLFQMLLAHKDFSANLITQRIALALENRNVSLAQYLLLQYKPSRMQDIKTLQTIYQRPATIANLQPGALQDEFYLYGLKRLISSNINQAVTLWNNVKTKKILNDNQQQSFLITLTIYKAMRNAEDTPTWFAKIKPAYYSDALLEWQIRFALKGQQWKQVDQLIGFYKDKSNPCWQYWLARAKAAQGQKDAAKAIYEILAKTRNYYGFLASMQLNIAPTFQNEKPISNTAILKPYQPLIDKVANLYTTKQTLQASRILNDFFSELPKEDASALVYWIDQNLQWHGKSVYLSNTEILNNQLALRFPLAYKDTVMNYAKNYALPDALVYAIIRQESAFRDDVISTAGARGLMQLMPATASMVAKREKIGFTDIKQLFISQKNINLGVAYLSQLSKRFGNHPILMAAAYNAGPKQLQYWLKNHPPKKMDIWIETLPWQETRNYLKNVVAFYTVYQYRMQLKPDMKNIMQSL
jgi:soluble lytic murein transglycosylase